MPDDQHRVDALTPVVPEEERPPTSKLEDGIGLCLSGGGYRAMLFHLGTLWRLNEAGYLPTLARISSVSGGSITSATLGLKWGNLRFDAQGVAQGLTSEVVEPIRRLAGDTIDQPSILGGLFGRGSIADKVAKAYRKHLFGNATLQDLPNDPPRFVINATSVQSGALWRFMKPYMADWKVGEIKKPEVQLAVAVAASSAFPPVLSPLRLPLNPNDFSPGNEPLHHGEYLQQAVLTDGGVYDNLGLETVWKRYKTVFVSDGGGRMEPEPDPKSDWIQHGLRVNALIDNQVRALRKRQVVGSLDSKTRNGGYWSIWADINEYQPAVALPCPHDKTLALARVKTRLAKLDATTQQRLINWGYAVTDAALRKYYDQNLPRPNGFPYPGGVG